MYIREVAVARAPDIVLGHLQKRGGEEREIRRIGIFAGDSVTCGRLHAWLVHGAWRPQSEAAAQIADLCFRVAAVLP